MLNSPFYPTHAFTATVVGILHEDDEDKSDNCATQYKCKWVFKYWQSVAIRKQKKVIIYYGVSGHGKGTVDGMSGFGVKQPLRRAVTTNENVSYNSAEDIYLYLRTLFANDTKKHYYLIDKNDIKANKITDPLPIKGCMGLHMISFDIDGRVQGKVNLCSCNECIQGNFVSYFDEKGYVVNVTVDDSSSCSDLSEYEMDDFSEEPEIDSEIYEIRNENVLEMVNEGNTIALYSPSYANELFYLCKVIRFGKAEAELTDKFNHVIHKDECFYYEKVREYKSKVLYNLLPDKVLVYPSQVMPPLVLLGVDATLTMEEYQWISDSI